MWTIDRVYRADLMAWEAAVSDGKFEVRALSIGGADGKLLSVERATDAQLVAHAEHELVRCCPG